MPSNERSSSKDERRRSAYLPTTEAGRGSTPPPRSLLRLFANVPVCRPDWTGRRPRIGVVAGRSRRRLSELATGTAGGKPYSGPPGAFVVEDAECRQTDVGDFF